MHKKVVKGEARSDDCPMPEQSKKEAETASSTKDI